MSKSDPCRFPPSTPTRVMAAFLMKQRGRNVPIAMIVEVLRKTRRVFTWGLDQYANRTGAKVDLRYWRILAMDGTPKRYIILAADKAT